MKIRYLLIFSIQFYALSAQIPLTTTTNTLRHGDILCKVEVPYVEAGERGEEVGEPQGQAVWSNPLLALSDKPKSLSLWSALGNWGMGVIGADIAQPLISE